MPDADIIAFTPRPPSGRRKKKRPTVNTPPGAELDSLIDSWLLNLQAANKADETIRAYLRSARYLIAFLTEQGMPTDAERVEPEHIRAFLVAERERTTASSAACHHANLGVFWQWLVEEEERSTPSPVLAKDKPKKHSKRTKYLTDAQLQAVYDACKGPGFAERRDLALFRLFNDCGVRVSGASGALLADLDLKAKTLLIRLKGGNEHLAPFGDRTAAALDRYLRVRRSHPLADSPWLWLGQRGRASGHLTPEGIRVMMRRRGKQAGVADLRPHRFRARFAHEFLAEGGSARGAMSVAGWRSEAMLHHYSEELAQQRAREEHARLRLGDRF
ncbi:tyrosine-type recombinase/integrase [Streptosporangium sp. NPDC049078]|uniref:tyrosine-type recombinase/integrase n=1 Tax=Streptosporangium sp. NPDC049078 TaxID=3155767 RepID=UPI00344A96FC